MYIYYKTSLTFVGFLLVEFAFGLRYVSLCKWSNEDCNSDGECCSQRCVQVHPGTNARCMKTSMGGPCLYSFHCGYRMDCSINNKCCAKHWGTCKDDVNCCHPGHLCQRVTGFIYKKCRRRSHYLPMAGGSASSTSSLLLHFTIMSIMKLIDMYICNVTRGSI